MKKIKLQEPEYRCKKCKTPLSFISNSIRSEKEIKKLQAERMKHFNWFQRLFYTGGSGWEDVVNQDKQRWSCPKCFEEYIIEFEKDIPSTKKIGCGELYYDYKVGLKDY